MSFSDLGLQAARSPSSMRRGLLSPLSKRRHLCELFARCRQVGALAFEKIIDCSPEPRIDDVMRRISCRRKIAARYLVLALRSRLDTRKPVLDGVLDGLVIAEFEMQEWVVLDGAPMPTEQRVGADEIDGARDPSAAA